MNITISDPTPAPEMPVLFALVGPSGDLYLWGVGTENAKVAEEDSKRYPGSRFIKIDPNAPSFEPGPTEWVDSEGWSCSVDTVVKVRSLNTRTDIGRVISALVTKWHEAKEGT